MITFDKAFKWLKERLPIITTEISRPDFLGNPFQDDFYNYNFSRTQKFRVFHIGDSISLKSLKRIVARIHGICRYRWLKVVAVEIGDEPNSCVILFENGEGYDELKKDFMCWNSISSI